MTTTYTASRDSDNSRTDEDKAMAHELIYHGGDLDLAREAMANYMRQEAEYLRRHADTETDDRADAIELSIVEVVKLDPEHNQRAIVKSAGLVWSLYRRDAA